MRKMAPAAARRRGGDGAAVLRQGFAKLYGGGGVLERERKAPKAWDERPSLPPTIYRGPRGGAGPRRCNLLGGAAAKGGIPPPQGT